MLKSRSVRLIVKNKSLLFKPKIVSPKNYISYCVGDEADMKNIDFRRPLLGEILQTDLYTKHAAYVRFVLINKGEEYDPKYIKESVWFWGALGLIWFIPTVGLASLPFVFALRKHLKVQEYIYFRNLSNDDFVFCCSKAIYEKNKKI